MQAFDNTPMPYPEDLLDGTFSEATDRKWWVMYTKARQEKALARDLFGYKIPSYLPLIAAKNVYKRRTIVSYKPIFTSYVFVFGTDDERVTSLTTNRISRVLDVSDPERLRFDLHQLQHLVASGAPLTVESQLIPGDRVRIKHGSLAGLEGTVMSRRGATRLMVSVDFLQRGASVAIDDHMIEPIG